MGVPTWLLFIITLVVSSQESFGEWPGADTYSFEGHTSTTPGFRPGPKGEGPLESCKINKGLPLTKIKMDFKISDYIKWPYGAPWCPGAAREGLLPDLLEGKDLCLHTTGPCRWAQGSRLCCLPAVALMGSGEHFEETEHLTHVKQCTEFSRRLS